MVVLLDYDTLLSGLGTARLDTGERISAGLARRLACQAGVIPAVVRRLVDGRSVVLDLGRKRRLHTEHMRIALAVEQGGCTAEHCDRPAGWCHAHHDVPWSAGGPTSVTNGRLLCSFHHHKAHSTELHPRPTPERPGPVPPADVRQTTRGPRHELSVRVRRAVPRCAVIRRRRGSPG